MNQEELFNGILQDLENRLHLLEDKPEETPGSTLKALWLMASGLSKSVEEAIRLPLPVLTETQKTGLYQLIAQRLNNRPLAHITGRQSFMGIEMLSDHRALIPRKETEILGRKALELSKVMAETMDTIPVIDVCCGAGNLGLAIARYNPKCIVYASDLSPGAVDLTRENIAFLGLGQRVQAQQGDLLSAWDRDEFHGKVELIVCNPPYISSAKVPKMNPEISANEPSLAFDGGMLGTAVVQKLIREAPRFLPEGGILIFEVGLGQGPFIMQLCERSRLYRSIEPVTDEAGNVRVIGCRL
jgi:release factor glutamine methyltransferase